LDRTGCSGPPRTSLPTKPQTPRERKSATADILQRIGIDAPPAEIHRSLSTIEGLASWWTDEVTGDPSVGGTLTFTFGSPDRGASMQVVSSTPGEEVTWRCVAGPDEWLGTTFTFALEPLADETVLLFTNAGWRETVPFMGHCTTKWAYYLLGLKAGLEGGKATPFPGSLEISGWDRPAAA
jgi:uncharacterized protein YndB with AHSA1/START domain